MGRFFLGGEGIIWFSLNKMRLPSRVWIIIVVMIVLSNGSGQSSGASGDSKKFGSIAAGIS